MLESLHKTRSSRVDDQTQLMIKQVWWVVRGVLVCVFDSQLQLRGPSSVSFHHAALLHNCFECHMILDTGSDFHERNWKNGVLALLLLLCEPTRGAYPCMKRGCQ